MKLYLSSFKLGHRADKLPQLIGQNTSIGFIANASDASVTLPEVRLIKNQKAMAELQALGLSPELLDLREYFGKSDQLRTKLSSLGGVFVKGGNTFVLRQAMHLSGFDMLFSELLHRENFLYAGYSAGICILAESLQALQIVDNPYLFPYPELQKTIWEGLGLLPYMILPHYKSDHPESEAIDREVESCIENKHPFIVLKDGEVLIMDSGEIRTNFLSHQS